VFLFGFHLKQKSTDFCLNRKMQKITTILLPKAKQNESVFKTLSSLSGLTSKLSGLANHLQITYKTFANTYKHLQNTYKCLPKKLNDCNQLEQITNV
jgi:hypothetical protein